MSLVVHWLKLHASKAKTTGLIPGWGTKIPHATQYHQNKQTHRCREQSSGYQRGRGVCGELKMSMVGMVTNRRDIFSSE